MKTILKYIPVTTAAVIYLSIFIFSIYPPQDPDLGWHLKYGEYFFKTGSILRDNTFSALMPNYHWNNSSWATDLLTYQTFHILGFIGIIALGALVVTATFFFLGKAAKLTLFEKAIIFPMILYFTSPVNMISFRGQQLSLFFLAILYYILSRYESNKKIIFALIPLFVLWSNFHGEFILGLAIFFIWTFVYIAKEIYFNYKLNLKKLVSSEKNLILAFFLSVGATLINPFGLNIYLETFKHLNDPMQKAVAEWLSPLDFSTIWWHQLFTGLVMVMGIALLGIGKKNLDKAPFYTPSSILFIFTFWIRRYAWPFYYSSVFLFKPVVAFFKPDSEKHTNYAAFVISIIFLTIVVLYKYPLKEVRSMSWDSYCYLSVSCSAKSADFVIGKKLNTSRLLTIYDYGGWLIWNYPKIRPTIDGRMHLWRDKNGYSGFEYFYPIEQNTTGDIDNSPYDAVFTSKRKPIYFRLLELQKEEKWKPLYIDKFSAVFVRNKSATPPNTN